MPDEREHVFKNINNMVVKKTNGSGGYGMLMGHASTEEEIEEYKLEILKDPRNFIAQPTISLSAAPCYIGGRIAAKAYRPAAIRPLRPGRDRDSAGRPNPRGPQQRARW
jgi:uncharacterized circularly permuted ATP-grasp superfamily protein